MNRGHLNSAPVDTTRVMRESLSTGKVWMFASSNLSAGAALAPKDKSTTC